MANISMAARLIHFGLDDCYRVNVLRRAGYEIDDCTSLVQLREALESNAEADAVMLNGVHGSIPFQAISITRSRIPAPIVLFTNPGHTYPIDKIDLIVPAFTRPTEWLLDLAKLIIHYRTVRSRSQLIREHSEMLRRQSAQARAKSLRDRLLARQAIKFGFPSPFNSDGSSK